MKQRKRFLLKPFYFIILLLLFCTILPSHKAMAYTVQSSQHVYDDANLLTDDDITQLEQTITSLKKKWKIDIFILTTQDRKGLSIGDYADHFIGKCDDSKYFSKNNVILSIDISTRDVNLSGYGLCEMYVSNSRCTSIREEITPFLSSEDYITASQMFLEGVDKYMGIDPFYFKVWFQLLIAVIIAAIIVGLIAANRGSGITTTANTYLDKEHSELKAHRDTYIRTSVTRKKKPESSSSSKGGGGGSGRSHSSSSGKF